MLTKAIETNPNLAIDEIKVTTRDEHKSGFSITYILKITSGNFFKMLILK